MQVPKQIEIFAPKESTGSPIESYFTLTNTFGSETISAVGDKFSFSSITKFSKSGECASWYAPTNVYLEQISIVIDDTSLVSATIRVNNSSGTITSQLVLGGTGLQVVTFSVEAEIEAQDYVDLVTSSLIGSYEIYAISGIFYFSI